MFSFYELSVFIAIFLIVALASEQFGKWFAKIHLPLITGFLFTGIIAGPYVLGMIPEKAVSSLRFIDDIALAFIAFAAGCELIIDEMKGAMKSIKWVTICLVICTFVFGSTATFFLTDYLSFAQSFSVEGKIAISILAGAILVARSPSSAIAIIKELRARGSFTRTVLGVTVVMDVVVIVLFSISLSIAFAIISDSAINPAFFGLLCLELLISPVIGYLVARILCFILSLKKIKADMRTYLILALGYGVFIGADFISNLSAEMFSFHFRPEPLLICMVGAFIVTNFSEYGSDLNNILHRVGHMVYVAFFTLTGAALTLSILTKIWAITLTLFFVRAISIFIGSFIGGVIAKAPIEHSRISWMGYLTQAGVGLGLAKLVGVSFPEWGAEFTTMMVSVIVVNQIVGPPLFKWSLFLVGEAHRKAKKSDADLSHYAIICGAGGQAHALAKQLHMHEWKVKIAYTEMEAASEDLECDFETVQIKDFSFEELQKLDAKHAGAIVTLLTDDENYNICEMAYEHFGNANLIANINNRNNVERFKELNVFVVRRATAIVSLLDHYVRSPSAVTLLLGDDDDHDVIDVEIKNPDLIGVSLRKMQFPTDIIFLSVCRKGKQLNVHNYYRFREGDTITIAGSNKSLRTMTIYFSIHGWASAVEMHGIA